MKKILIFLFFGLGVIFSTSLCIKKAQANQLLQYGHIIIEDGDKIAVDGIRVDLYQQTDSDSVDSHISVYHNQILESIPVSLEGEFSFCYRDKYYLEMDLDTLPKGYGVLQKIVNAQLDNNFRLYAISDCQIAYVDDVISIQLLNEVGDEIYANTEYFIENLGKDNNENAFALIKVIANGVVFHRQLPISSEEMYNQFQEMLFSHYGSYSKANYGSLTAEKTQITRQSDETIQINEHIIKYKMISTYDSYYDSNYALTQNAIDEKETFIKQEINSVFHYLYSKGYRLKETDNSYFAFFEVSYVIGMGNPYVDNADTYDTEYDIHLDISVTNDSVAMVKAKIFHEIYHAVVRNITNNIIAKDAKIDEGLATFMELYYMGIDNNYLYLDYNQQYFFQITDFVDTQDVKINDSKNFDEIERLHYFISNYRDNAFVYNNSQYNYQLFLPSTGRQTLAYENCVVYLVFYKLCDDDQLFHQAIIHMIKYIETLDQDNNIKLASFKNILSYYNSRVKDEMTMAQFEEYVANILFYPEKLCNILCDDFTYFDSINNIWQYHKSLPCYAYRNNIKYELTDDAISLFQLTVSNLKNKVGITSISVDSEVEIRLLNQNFEVIYRAVEKNFTLIVDENESIKDYYIEFVSTSAENRIQIQYQTYNKFDNGSYEIDKDSLNSDVTQILYQPKQTGIYTVSSILSLSNCDDKMSKKADITVYQLGSGDVVPSMMDYENRDTSYVYYLDANYYYILNIRVKLENASVTIHIDSDYDKNVSNITSYTIFEQNGIDLKGITQLHFKGYGNYNISLDYIPEPFTASFDMFQVKLIKYSDNDIVEIYTGNITTFSKSIITRCDLKDNDIVFALYDHPDMVGKILIETVRYDYIDNVFSLVPDKRDVDINLVGTEVKLNDGQRESAICTVGFTRCLFPHINAPTLLRENYYWFSDNEDIASVSGFGTVQAKRSGIVNIYCVYKYNFEYFGVITITVNQDSNHSLVDLSYGLDCRANGVSAGTEVTSGKGERIPIDQYSVETVFSIHRNHTRLICIGSDSPTSYLQDFLWESSDSSKVYVSSYGTIMGINPTDGDNYVTITGIYKYNSRYRIQLKIYCYE